MIPFDIVDAAVKSSVLQFPHKDKFAYLGFIGSLNVEHDLDMLFLPQQHIPLGEFFIGIVDFLDILKKELAAQGVEIIVFTYRRWEEETKWIAHYIHGKDVLFHIVTHVDWEFPPAKVKKILIDSVKKTGQSYIGSAEDIEHLSLLRYDPHYVYLLGNLCFHARYPLELLNAKLFEVARYLSKQTHYRPSERLSARELFVEMCRYVDAMVVSKKHRSP